MAVEAKPSGSRKFSGNGVTSVKTHTSVGLKQFTKWKQICVEEMLKDEELMKLMYYNTENCLIRPSVKEEDRHGMINSQIYQYRFIEAIAEKKKSYVSMDLAHFQPLEEFRLFSDDYIHGYLYFYIIADIDILNTDYGVRVDLIAERIYDIFEGYEGIGIGELKLESQVPLWLDNNAFGGYALGFRVSEFK